MKSSSKASFKYLPAWAKAQVLKWEKKEQSARDAGDLRPWWSGTQITDFSKMGRTNAATQFSIMKQVGYRWDRRLNKYVPRASSQNMGGTVVVATAAAPKPKPKQEKVKLKATEITREQAMELMQAFNAQAGKLPRNVGRGNDLKMKMTGFIIKNPNLTMREAADKLGGNAALVLCWVEGSKGAVKMTGSLTDQKGFKIWKTKAATALM